MSHYPFVTEVSVALSNGRQGSMLRMPRTRERTPDGARYADCSVVHAVFSRQWGDHWRKSFTCPTRVTIFMFSGGTVSGKRWL